MDMNISTTTTVGELAARLPDAARILEKYGIDYCCGGGNSMGKACAVAGIDAGKVIEEIQRQSTPGSAQNQDFFSLNQRGLVELIVTTHHVFTRQELARLDALMEKVVSVHGGRHPELAEVQNTFRLLADDLLPHMQKEENILFPYIAALEVAADGGEAAAAPPFMTVRNPVRMMTFEHEAAGTLLRELRRLTSGYTAPADGCISYRTLYAALENLERDLHQHIHLENNILFPRAVEAEMLQRSV
jgi:regulator of cell morphogenesis and NO signaling